MRETVMIHGIGSEMQGVGRLADGRAVFVPGALPGETVEIRITKSKDRWAEAECLSVQVPSPDRREPVCPHYAVCGGCRTQHMSYEAALRFKREHVLDVLTRIGGIKDAVVRDTLPAEPHLRTRNKAEYDAGRGADGKPVLGMHAERSSAILPVDDCLLQHEASIRALRVLQQDAAMPHLSGAVTRVTRDGKLMLILTGITHSLSGEAALTDRLRKALPDMVSLYYCQLNLRPKHALDGRCRLIWGANTVTDTLCGLRFSLSPQSFFQVNPLQAEKLYRTAIEAAAIQPGDLVLDAYCGAGTITLCAAQRSARTIGVEIVAPAIENARINAKANGLDSKAEFILGDAAVEIPKLTAKRLRPDVVITDPPRKGMDKKLVDSLLTSLPERIVYVSCDPATLARDVKLLSEKYTMEYAVPVDMFPLSAHVETVVLLSKMNTPKG